MDFIKLAYNESFKHKYQAEYDRTLKSMTGHPSEALKYSGITKGTIQPIANW